MPYVRPNPLTVAHSVAFLQLFVLRRLPKSFVVGSGAETAVDTLALFLRPAIAKADEAREVAGIALRDAINNPVRKDDMAQELLLHLELLRTRLPVKARRAVIMVLVALLAAAGDGWRSSAAASPPRALAKAASAAASAASSLAQSKIA